MKARSSQVNNFWPTFYPLLPTIFFESPASMALTCLTQDHEHTNQLPITSHLPPAAAPVALQLPTSFQGMMTSPISAVKTAPALNDSRSGATLTNAFAGATTLAAMLVVSVAHIRPEGRRKHRQACGQHVPGQTWVPG